jgi:hypothetical protein
MKAVIFTTCLLLAATGYSRWIDLAQELAGSARQQIPNTLAAMMFERTGGGVRATQPGQEKVIEATLKEALRSLRQDSLLRDATVELKQVRYVTTKVSSNVPTQNRSPKDNLIQIGNPANGHYLAVLQYDLMNPLTMETGATLLAATCSSGVTQVRLSDGFDVVKTFRCPDLKR